MRSREISVDRPQHQRIDHRLHLQQVRQPAQPVQERRDHPQPWISVSKMDIVPKENQLY